MRKRTYISFVFALVTLGTAAQSEEPVTYYLDYIVSPSKMMIQVLADRNDSEKVCDKIDASAITPELVKKSGTLLHGFSFINGNETFGYVTWTSDKTGVHTTFIANYILRNCSLSETRIKQRTFDGPNRNAIANAEYNRLIVETLGTANVAH